MISLGWPQVILLVLIAMGVGVSMSRFGEQKRDKHDWGDVLIAPAIILGLLWWGGFFHG